MSATTTAIPEHASPQIDLVLAGVRIVERSTPRRGAIRSIAQRVAGSRLTERRWRNGKTSSAENAGVQG